MKTYKGYCPTCGEEFKYYSSMMTGACLKCHEHHRGVYWSEEEYKKGLEDVD